MGASASVPEQSSVHDFTVQVLLLLFRFIIQCFDLKFNPKDFICEAQDSMGKDVNLSIYKGKVLLIVNVASKWFVFLSLS